MKITIEGQQGEGKTIVAEIITRALMSVGFVNVQSNDDMKNEVLRITTEMEGTPIVVETVQTPLNKS